jgi:outer membrane protein OmpA-like peptidoglycan-associated protein
LFNSGENTVREDAADKLQQVAASLSKRFNGGQIRVYGHTDAAGSAESNKELAEARAEAVKSWLVN